MVKLSAMEKNTIPSEQLKELMHAAAVAAPKSKSRTIKHKKTPRIPACVGKLPIKAETSKRTLAQTSVVLQKAPKSHYEQLSCNANQKNPLFLIEKAEELMLKKVENFKVKERLIALQSIRRLAAAMQQCIHAQIRGQIQKESRGTEEFYDLLAKREERHFRLDRIIRYLSDP